MQPAEPTAAENEKATFFYYHFNPIGVTTVQRLADIKKSL
jgi:hypothetical protein